MSASKKGSRRSPAPVRQGRGSLAWLLVGGFVVVAGIAAIVASRGGDGTVVTIDAPAVVVEGGALSEHVSGAPDPAVGTPAPGLSGEDFSGAPISLAADGRPKVVLFLAHWCPHCQAEVPVVQGWLDDTGGSPDVDLYSVATAIDPDRPNYPPQSWLEREGWTSPVLVDPDNGASRAYGLSSFPFWVFIDADGNVAGRYAGELDIDTFAAQVEQLAQA